MTESAPHIPVLCAEVVKALSPRDGSLYLDGTFGAGGYSRAILNAAQCRVIALDRDPGVRPFAERLRAEFADRFVFLAGTFGEMVALLAKQGISQVEGVVLDLGVSSMQIDTPERGFSFRFDGPLDMRMGSDGMSAAELIATADEGALADILFHYGEERNARRIARAIVAARAEAPIERTKQLVDIIHRVNGSRKEGGIDPATRSFQGLRIAVNRELEELENALSGAERLLPEGGRCLVVTFHSLEDRMVKRWFRPEIKTVSRHLPETAEAPACWRDMSRVFPADEESARNPRARSATLRAATRTAASARPVSGEVRPCA